MTSDLPPTRRLPDLAAAKAVIDVAREVVAGAEPAVAERRSTPSRCWPTTWPTPRPRSRRAGPCSATARRATSRPALACAFVADAVADLAAKVFGREAEWGVEPGDALDEARPVRRHLPRSGLPGRPRRQPRAPPPRRRLRARAGHVPALRRREDPPGRRAHPPPQRRHPRGRSSPAWPRWAASACRSPRSTAATAMGGETEYIGMVVATEELSRGSLGVGGSLITRPEILTRALLAGGTEEQKHEWLPKLATAEVMAAVAVTEPDFGSDVAGIKVTATPTDGGWLINGVKTWCTFGARADVLMLLARTDPDRSQDPPRPVDVHRAEAGRRRPRLRVRRRPRRQDGRSPDRHHRLPRHALLRDRLRQLVRGRPRTRSACDDGLGRGFYYQMAGFENGRLQTAARAVGVMQAAYEEALAVRRRPRRVRPADRRLPAHPGQARPHGGAHPGRPPVRLRRGPH